MRVAQRAAAQWGVLSLDELRACGLTRQAVSVRVRNGRLHPLHRGVYAVGHGNPPLEGHFLAAVKACGADAVLSHVAAAALWELLAWDHRDPEVTVPGGATRIHAGLRVHRTATLAAEDRMWRRGVPVTSPARTLVDLAAVVESRALRRAARQAEVLGLVRPGELAETLARLRPCRGARRLARIIAAGPAPTRSVLEDAVLDLIVRGGLERPDVNVPLLVAGRRVVPDFRWAHERLIVEADGAAWHDTPLARAADAERQALLEASGEHVVRVTWDQVVAHPQQTLARYGPPAPRRRSTLERA